MAIVAADGRLIALNRKARELFGDPGPAARIGEVFADDGEKLRSYLRLCSRTSDTVPALLHARTEKGELELRCDGAVLETRAGDRPALLMLRFRPRAKSIERFLLLNEKLNALTREIQRRQRVEEALRESEASFRELADSMPQIVWTARPDGSLDYYNRRWYEQTCATPSLTGEQSWIPVVHPDDLKTVTDRWYASVLSGQRYEIECRYLAKDGQYRWHLVRAEPVHDAGGVIVRWFGTSTDIDDKKRTEFALGQQAEELRRSNADLEDFAYIASHDLKEPLRGISTFSALLREEHAQGLNPEAERMLQSIEGLSKRMYLLLDSLLEYARVGRGDLDIAPASLAALARESVESLRTRLDESGAIVEVGELPTLRCDRILTGQVLSNLISNAIKYNKSEIKRIEIGCQPTIPPTIYVRDNGIGIPPQHLGAIFRIFKRLHQRKDFGGGAGVGLAIVKKIVERHGGRVWAESGPGGSTFCFTLGPADVAPFSVPIIRVDHQLPAGSA